MSAPQLVLYGNFGVGNFGNDNSLEAMLYNIRKYQPSANVTCVCNGPQVIEERFGIQTLPVDINEFSRGRQKTGRELHIVTRLASRIADEIDFWLRRTHWLKSVDQFIVVGTSPLDDAGVHPWNAPYDLFKWCSAAKLAGTKLVFLSVGAGPLVHRFSRALLLGALRMADYRSYRDVVSFDCLHSVGFGTSGDSLYPDLVWSLPERAWSRSYTSSTQLQTVGLGVMGYYGRNNDPNSGESIYLAYLSKLKQFVRWLLDQGYAVRLLIGNWGVDQRPVDELVDFARSEGPVDWQGRIFSDAIANADDLFRQIAHTDIVVASRFHNIVSALLLGRPVVSLAYHEKNDALLAEMGLQSYCQHIEQFSVDVLIRQFQSLTGELEQASERIRKKGAQYRQLLDEQYRRVLCPEPADAVRNGPKSS